METHDFVYVPGEQRFIVGKRLRLGQVLKDMTEVAIGFAVVGLGCLNQAVEQGAGLGPFGRACKEPVLPVMLSSA